MSKNIEKLISVSSSAISTEKPVLEGDRKLECTLINSLEELLKLKNGFYAFESALHVFPSNSTDLYLGLDKWNDSELWINDYAGLASDCFFFAEDIFGCQFCIKHDQIHIFDPETGELEFFSDDFEEWSREILNDYEVLTGYPLAHQWQQRNGKILPGKRLLPKIPFVAGGEFEIENLYILDSVEGMRFRASLANQIKDLPDGAQIKLKVTD